MKTFGKFIGSLFILLVLVALTWLGLRLGPGLQTSVIGVTGEGGKFFTFQNTVERPDIISATLSNPNIQGGSLIVSMTPSVTITKVVSNNAKIIFQEQQRNHYYIEFINNQRFDTLTFDYQFKVENMPADRIVEFVPEGTIFMGLKPPLVTQNIPQATVQVMLENTFDDIQVITQNKILPEPEIIQAIPLQLKNIAEPLARLIWNENQFMSNTNNAKEDRGVFGLVKLGGIESKNVVDIDRTVTMNEMTRIIVNILSYLNQTVSDERYNGKPNHDILQDYLGVTFEMLRSDLNRVATQAELNTLLDAINLKLLST